jgi:signal transduction histidine kinase
LVKLEVVENSPATREITQGSVTRVLAIGFSLVIAVLLIGGSVEFRSIASIQRNISKLVDQEQVTRDLIENLQEEQKTLSQIFYTLTGDPDTADPVLISQRLAQVEKTLDKLSKAGSPGPMEHALWNDLLSASHGFGVESRRLLAEPGSSFETGSRDLFRRHEEVIHFMSRLVSIGFQRILDSEHEIGQQASAFNRQSMTVVLVSLALALLVSILTARKTGQLLKNMTWQEKELARVSWQMVEDQETIARRFSHEIHDELGQTLAALKSNIAAVSRRPDNEARLADSTRLVDEAIRNVRQLSQLLRPMILDDFGIDAGLNWLCEGFMQRTGVEVDYKSNFHKRLPDEVETHLFRIAQEALTNVARHSGASKVSVKLHSADNQIRLRVADNGKGFDKAPADPTMPQSLGMTGMRARARAVGGVFEVLAPEGKGVSVEARVPYMEGAREEYESHSHIAG